MARQIGNEKSKTVEIERMVSIVKQIDLTGIELLTRDANTLLMRQKMIDPPQPRKTG